MARLRRRCPQLNGLPLRHASGREHAIQHASDSRQHRIHERRVARQWLAWGVARRLRWLGMGRLGLLRLGIRLWLGMGLGPGMGFRLGSLLGLATLLVQPVALRGFASLHLSRRLVINRYRLLLQYVVTQYVVIVYVVILRAAFFAALRIYAFRPDNRDFGPQ